MSADASLGLTDVERRRVEYIDRLVALGTRGIDELIASLGDPSWTVRRAAVGALAAFGDEAIPRLCTWLRSARTSEHAIAAVVDTLVASIGTTAGAAVSALLDEPRPEVVADAAVVLGRRRDAAVTPRLVRLLEHADDNVAVAAIEALGLIGGTGAVEALTAVIRERGFFRTFAALQVLPATGDPRAIAPLAELLDDDMFRIDAVRALGSTGSAAAIPPLARVLASTADGDVERARLVALALGDLIVRAAWYGATPTVAAQMRESIASERDHIVAALAGASSAERIAIARVLGTIGDDATLPVLVPLLDDPDVQAVATSAIQRIASGFPSALGDAIVHGTTATRIALLPIVGNAREAVAIRGLLADDDAELRARACEALARIGDTGAVPALFDALGDPSPRVSHAAVAAIHSLGARTTAHLAIRASRSGRHAVRRHALRIIGYLGCREAFDAVMLAIDDDDARIAELAVCALGALEDPRVDAILCELARRPNDSIRAATMRAAGQRGGDAMAELLVRGLSDDSAWVRYYACQGLGRLGRGMWTSALVVRLSDAYPQVRIAAIEALARLDTAQAWQALTSVVRSADPDEERAALVGLSQAPRAVALPYLLAAARSRDTATRLIALAGLARSTEPHALEELGHAARGDDGELRDAALSLLADRSDRAAADLLVEIALASDVDHPVHAALSRPGAARIAAIASRLTIADDRAAVVLAPALARMLEPRATAALFEALAATSPDARRAAANALIASDAPGARDAVARLAVEDPDRDVRRACQAAVGSPRATDGT